MKESSIEIFNNYTDEELQKTLVGLNSMDSTDIFLLKQELIKREMFEASFSIDVFFSETFDPAILSLKEIQELVSARLQTGESIESIKLDLADHGITLEHLINNEAQRMNVIFSKIEEAPLLGKNETSINEELKSEYNYSDEEIIEVKRNLKSRTVLYTIIGVILTIISLFQFFLTLFNWFFL